MSILSLEESIRKLAKNIEELTAVKGRLSSHHSHYTEYFYYIHPLIREWTSEDKWEGKKRNSTKFKRIHLK